MKFMNDSKKIMLDIETEISCSNHSDENILQYHDEDFIDAAYQNILQREVDIDGRVYYLEKLRNGTLSKDEVIMYLKNSTEGKALHHLTFKEKFVFRLHQYFQLPMIGYILQFMYMLFTLPLLMKRIRENDAFVNRTLFQMKKRILALSSKVSYVDLDEVLKDIYNQVEFQKRVHEKKVLICSNAYPPNFIGGAELIAHYQAKSLKDMGYEVKVFAGDFSIDAEHYAVKHDKFDGIDVYRIKLTVDDFDANGINFMHTEVEKYFQKILYEYKPNIVHMHNIIGLSIRLPYLAKREYCKTILTLHDGWGFCFKNTITKNDGTICHNYQECEDCMSHCYSTHRRAIPIQIRQDFFKLALRDIDTFISPSEYLKNQYVKSGLNPNQIVVIDNGIDIDKFRMQKSQSDIVRFSYIGNIGIHKGIMVLLDAIVHLNKTHKFYLNIVGEGTLSEKVKEYIHTHSLSNVVNYVGKVSNEKIVDIFQETDVYILPSMWPENQPVTITEAFACNTPVIGTDLGGIKELVIPHVNGLLFPWGDSQGLADKMMHFIDNPSDILIYGNNGYQMIKEKTFINQVTKIATYYHATKEINLTKKPFIVVCIGEVFSHQDLEMIKEVKQKHSSIYFIIDEWMDKISSIDLFLVLGCDGNSIDDRYFIKEKPIILPDTYKNQKNSQDYFTLYYQNSKTAKASIEYIYNLRESSHYD